VAAERRFWLSRGDLNITRQNLLLALSVALLLCPASAWAWGLDGHKIVAVIAADNLTPAAASHVAIILGAPPGKRGLATAMEAASILPDTEFRDEDKTTAAWHFIDICLQDRRADIAARCPGGNCVTAKIDEYSKRLKDGNYDRWRAFGDLAFLVHFVGDIHQPLHAASDADRGGNCIPVDSTIRAKNLHEAWDTPIVRRLEYSIDSGRPETTAHKLEKTYASEQAADSWIPADDVAWESNQVARTDIYAALHIPVEPCQPALNACIACINPAGRPVELDAAYLDQADAIAGRQLAKAGFRLASLLNEIWTQPVSPSDTPHASDPAPAPIAASNAAAGEIVGNRRSKIYAWPGCGTYDKMSPDNRVVFSTREAAEQQGYRAARNCP
jgi:hypothetical protein